MNIFIDAEDMEERYGEELYKEYLERENKELKQKVKYYENFKINKTIDKIRVENNKRFKEQQEELESLKQANEEHQKLNGELRVENDRLNNIINKGIEAINVYQNEKTLSVGYQDLKRIRGILQGNEFDLQMFEEYLQELKGSESNE